MEVTNAPASAEIMMKHGIADRAAFGLFLFMVFFAPVPDGSISFFWIEIWAAVAALVLLLASHRNLGPGQFLLLGGLLLVLASYGIIAWLQSISPGPAPLAIWSQAAEVLKMDIPPRSSSVAGTPLYFLGRPLLAALVLAGGMVFGADDRRANVLLRTVIYAACLFGLIGLVRLFLAPEEDGKVSQGSALTAFFINKNTTATYLGSAFLAALALLMAPFIKRIRQGQPLLGDSTIQPIRSSFPLAIGALLLILLLPLTLSRAGLLLTLLVGAASIGWRLRLRGRVLGVVAIGGIILVAAVFAFSGDVWRARQARMNVDTDPRWQAYGIIWDAVIQRPLLGYGLGSFAESFPQFRNADVGTGYFNIGHSTPLELAFEGGLPLALLVFAFIVILCAILVRGAMRRPCDMYILAALLVGLLGVLHSCVDFSLQMPGYLIICLAIVGIGLGRAFLPKEEEEARRSRRRRRHLSGGGGPQPEREASPTAS